MVKHLVSPVDRVQILAKHQLEEVRFQKDVHEARPCLDDSDVEDEDLSHNWEVYEVVHTPETVVLLVGQILHRFIPNLLFEIIYILSRWMNEQFLDVRIVPPFPFRIPDELEHFGASQ